MCKSCAKYSREYHNINGKVKAIEMDVKVYPGRPMVIEEGLNNIIRHSFCNDRCRRH